ncbi:hypothetical protein ACTPEF_24930, partial [Clostridioides difficile]
ASTQQCLHFKLHLCVISNDAILFLIIDLLFSSSIIPKKHRFSVRDKSIKALFVVNPNNPASIAMDETSCNNLIDVIENYNKDLM